MTREEEIKEIKECCSILKKIIEDCMKSYIYSMVVYEDLRIEARECFSRLIDMCNAEKVLVSYDIEKFKEDIPFLHGAYLHNRKEIYLEDLCDVRTLSHELGHHFAITKNGDFSEKTAERNGYKLFIKVCNKEIAKKYKDVIKGWYDFNTTQQGIFNINSSII